MTPSTRNRFEDYAMLITPVRTEEDYRAALGRIESLMQSEAGTSEGDLLDILVTLVEVYERKNYPLDLPDPVEAIKFHMERRGLKPKDLQPMIGRLNRVYEILNSTRPLTLTMIRNLHIHLGIPADSLIKEVKKAS
jgi:HTH-type transcriptional regulator/antitoxin HigA